MMKNLEVEYSGMIKFDRRTGVVSVLRSREISHNSLFVPNHRLKVTVTRWHTRYVSTAMHRTKRSD
jgi:hypothetical protein